MIRVSAGIVRRADGRILICQRGEGRNNAHLWEFPGGKQEAGESPEDCLCRELQEELALPIDHVQLLCQREEGGILFDFLTAETIAEPTLTEHEAYAFVQPREMLRYAFCPADTAVAREIALQSPALTDIFWDLDGTLMDTYPGMVKAFLRAAESLGIQTQSQRVLTLMKESLGHCCQVIAGENGVDAQEMLRAFRREEAHIDPDDIQPVPGIPEVLQQLKAAGCRHYVATHRDHVAIQYLTHAGLMELFSGGVYSEDLLPRKPAPDMLLHLISKHDLDPACCAMVGDRPLDVRAGRAAGVVSCLLDAEGRFPDEPCEVRTGNAAEISTLLRPDLGWSNERKHDMIKKSLIMNEH